MPFNWKGSDYHLPHRMKGTPAGFNGAVSDFYNLFMAAAAVDLWEMERFLYKLEKAVLVFCVLSIIYIILTSTFSILSKNDSS